MCSLMKIARVSAEAEIRRIASINTNAEPAAAENGLEVLGRMEGFGMAVSELGVRHRINDLEI